MHSLKSLQIAERLLVIHRRSAPVDLSHYHVTRPSSRRSTPIQSGQVRLICWHVPDHTQYTTVVAATTKKADRATTRPILQRRSGGQTARGAFEKAPVHKVLDLQACTSKPQSATNAWLLYWLSLIANSMRATKLVVKISTRKQFCDIQLAAIVFLTACSLWQEQRNVTWSTGGQIVTCCSVMPDLPFASILVSASCLHLKQKP